MRSDPAIPVAPNFRNQVQSVLDGVQQGCDIRTIDASVVLDVARDASVRLRESGVPQDVWEGATLRYIHGSAPAFGGNPGTTLFDLTFTDGVWRLVVVFRGVAPRRYPWRTIRTGAIHLTVVDESILPGADTLVEANIKAQSSAHKGRS